MEKSHVEQQRYREPAFFRVAGNDQTRNATELTGKPIDVLDRKMASSKPFELAIERESVSLVSTNSLLSFVRSPKQ